jgi:hypothetical protein
VRQGVRVLPGARRAQDEHKPQLPAAASGGYEASSDGSAHATKEEKVRTSGQALGGHKRLHYDGGGAADGVKDNKEQPIVKAKQPSPATVLRDFDLNMPAAVAATAIGDEAGKITRPEAKRARMLVMV